MFGFSDRVARAWPVRRVARSLLAQSRAYPFATNLSLVSIPIGLLAVIIGQDVSRAFTDVYNRPEPVYVWGVVLMLGGINVAYGIVWHVPSLERGGLYVLAVAYAFYGVSVIVGLGVGGLVTGPISLTLAISAMQRARVIFANAHGLLEVMQKIDVPVVTDVHSGLIAARPPATLPATALPTALLVPPPGSTSGSVNGPPDADPGGEPQ